MSDKFKEHKIWRVSVDHGHTLTCHIWPWSVNGGWYWSLYIIIAKLIFTDRSEIQIWHSIIHHSLLSRDNFGLVGKGVGTAASRVEYLVNIADFGNVTAVFHGRQCIPIRLKFGKDTQA